MAKAVSSELSRRHRQNTKPTNVKSDLPRKGSVCVTRFQTAQKNFSAQALFTNSQDILLCKKCYQPFTFRQPFFFYSGPFLARAVAWSSCLETASARFRVSGSASTLAKTVSIQAPSVLALHTAAGHLTVACGPSLRSVAKSVASPSGIVLGPAKDLSSATTSVVTVTTSWRGTCVRFLTKHRSPAFNTAATPSIARNTQDTAEKCAPTEHFTSS